MNSDHAIVKRVSHPLIRTVRDQRVRPPGDDRVGQVSAPGCEASKISSIAVSTPRPTPLHRSHAGQRHDDQAIDAGLIMNANTLSHSTSPISRSAIIVDDAFLRAIELLAGGLRADAERQRIADDDEEPDDDERAERRVEVHRVQSVSLDAASISPDQRFTSR